MSGEQSAADPPNQDVVEQSDVAVESSMVQTNSEETPQAEGEEIREEEFSLTIKTCTPDSLSLNIQVTPTDNIQDLKQYLYEMMNTSFITNYELFHNNQKVNEMADLRDIPDLKEQPVLEMRESNYNERTLRFHLRRVSEIVYMREDLQRNLTVYSSIMKLEEDTESKKQKGEKKEGQAETVTPPPNFVEIEPKLSNFALPQSNDTQHRLVREISLAKWNPPPSQRRVRGDILYIEIVTAENKVLQITGWTKGFFVNSSDSSHYNPAPSSPSYPTLVGLLSEVSPQFRKNMQSLFQYAQQFLPTELYPLNFDNHPWAKAPVKHRGSNDSNRGEEIFPLLNNEPDIWATGQLRDWNDEFQNCKEMPRESLNERIVRDRAVFRLDADFVAAAKKGATAILNKTVVPINPMDEEPAHMFIYNNIFFSHANDSREFYVDYGGDRAAHLFCNNDMKGIRYLNQADVPGLHTLLTAIVDYRGYRLSAQSIIPGILQREQTAPVVYGSIDNGKKIESNERFQELLSEAAAQLHLQPHVVRNEDREVPLCVAVESKGIIGTDGRHYVLDLFRMTPRDTNFSGKEKLATLLRPELIGKFSELLVARKMREFIEQNPESTPEQQYAQEVEESVAVRFNSNIHCGWDIVGTPEEISQQEKLVTDAATYLRAYVIPQFVQESVLLHNIPADGSTLTKNMHERGINMRYLGLISSHAQKTPVLKELAEAEMVVRAAKFIFREELRKTEDHELAQAVAHLLNSLLGSAGTETAPAKLAAPTPKKASPPPEITKKKSGKKKKDVASTNQFTTQAESPLQTMNRDNLWERVVAHVLERFNYQLDADRSKYDATLGKLSTLRNVCQKLGFHVDTQNYNFETPQPFSADNVIDILPLVKHINPQSKEAAAMVDVARQHAPRTFAENSENPQVSNQQRRDLAIEIYNEALSVMNAVYGPLHKDIFDTYSQLAMLTFQNKDLNTAIELQQKAAVTAERLFGPDHHDTLFAYANLSLYLQTDGKLKSAAGFMSRALYYNRLLYSHVHTDTAQLLNIAAVLVQDFGKFQQSIAYFLEAIKTYEHILGANHPQIGTLFHNVAIVYAQNEEWREALQYEKKNYNILKDAKISEEDPRMLECNIYLKNFTSRAVVQVKTRISQTRVQRITQVQKVIADTTTAAAPAPPVTRLGNRNVDEVMQYINERAPGSNISQRNKAKATKP